jgi:hypothetical protein
VLIFAEKKILINESAHRGSEFKRVCTISALRFQTDWEINNYHAWGRRGEERSDLVEDNERKWKLS